MRKSHLLATQLSEVIALVAPVIVAPGLEKIREHDIILITLFIYIHLLICCNGLSFTLQAPWELYFRVVVTKKIFCELCYITYSDGSQDGLARKAENHPKVDIPLTWAQIEDKLCLSVIKRIVTQQFLQLESGRQGISC